MRLLLSGLLMGFTVFANSLLALIWTKTYTTTAFIGPEIYSVERLKEGGGCQNGTLYGVRIGYEYLKRYKVYWGAEALWAQGTLKGHVRDESLKSILTDENIEGRVGYNFQSCCWRCASLTPYIGAGYFWEKNEYRNPSPLKIHFKNCFAYIPVGFLSQIFIYENFSIGLNGKVRIIIDGAVHVSHDPKYNKLTQNYEEKPQYRIELPLTYYYCWRSHSLACSLMPFYEYRPYGHRANYPFDFLETKFKIYGATFKLLYLF